MVGRGVEVEGLVLPRAVSGAPALELVNTLVGWDAAVPGDFLETYDHLAVLAGSLDLLPTLDVRRLRRAARRQPEAAAAALERACTVRSVVRSAVLNPDDPEAVAALTVASRSAASRFVLTPGRPARWRLTAIGTDDLDGPADAFAWAAADLVTRADVTRVRVCIGPGCGWLFVAGAGRRRWCSRQWCARARLPA